MNFEEKVYVVTGGAGAGAGRSGMHITRELAEKGAKAAVWDIADEAGEKLAAECGNVLYVHCDVTREDEVIAAVKTTLARFGHIDGLVNNAFWHADVQPPLHEVSLDEWDRHMNINLRAHFIVCKYVIPELLHSASSAIVNVGSTGARRGEDGYAAYSAAKAGLESLTRSVAVQYGRNGLRCNCLVPGLVLDPPMDEMIGSNPSLKAVFERIDRHNPSFCGHGNGQDVANGVLFLLADESRYINAQCIEMDGGTISHNNGWADGREQ